MTYDISVLPSGTLYQKIWNVMCPDNFTSRDEQDKGAIMGRFFAVCDLIPSEGLYAPIQS